MKYSYNWLKELSETEKNVDELAQMLLTHSFEVESVEDLSKGLEKIVIGEVITKEKHPNADRLNVAHVNIGTEKLQIVCGAPNLEVGQKVPVALVGAMLPGDFEIKKSEIRGVRSNGMICAEDELGIGSDHDGIIVLPHDAPVGEKFAMYTDRDDSILEIDVLPNRGHDALSYIGMANEIRTLEGKELITVQNDIPKIAENINISIITKRCRRYIGVKIQDVKITDSPHWLKTRLAASGIQSINNVVDITNYAMLETGQPLHAFDAEKVDHIAVRQAKKGEKIQLLDDTELELDDQDIVITENDRVTALAGVMGGKESGVSTETKDIILESASFDPTSVRFTQRKYNLQTDAAYRFERDVDPNIALVGALKAIKYFEEICGGAVQAFTDVYPEPVHPWSIELSKEKVVKLLGVEIAHDDIVDIMKRIGANIEKKNDDTLLIIPPTVRLDLQTQEDLIEEIGRIYGYNKITKEPLREKVQTPARNEERFFERMLKDIFTYNGFDEVRGYSFYSVDDARAVGLDDQRHISLLNPMSPEQAIMRRSLMPTLLHFTKKNFSYFDHVQIFEIGRIYDPTNKSLPDERLVVGATVGYKEENGSQFYTLKGVLENLFDRVNLGRYYFNDVFDPGISNAPNFHPSRKALIKTEGGAVLGWIGEVDKKTGKYFGLKKNRVAFCELDVVALMNTVKLENFYEPLARYPFISRDLSMIVGAHVRVADVERAIYSSGGELIKDVDLFDLYENTERTERSMAFHIVFGSDERTLKAEDADLLIQKIIQYVEENEDVQVKK
jgi:phenylalanyl-tRNA synthetase beta chain